MRRIGLAVVFVQMSALYHWCRIRKSATPRVDVSILFFLSLFVGSCLAFIVFIGVPARAQERPAGKVYRIGFLRAGPPLKGYLDGFQQGLRERGYVYGENVVVEFRATDGSVDQLPQFAEELVRMKVDVILASAASAAQAASRATASLPIVFVGVVDPVGLGLVPSLGRPGGNITGLAATAEDFAGKRLELLGAIVPSLKRVAVFWHPANPTNLFQLQGAQVAARTLGVRLEPVSVQRPNEFDSIGKSVHGTDGLLFLESPFFTTHRACLAQLAAQRRLPAIFGQKEYVEAGGLMSYGTDFQDLYRRAALYVDKILKGSGG
jgi:putative tryptophan/tyrosine transport system substrate-binding protein